MDSACPHLPSTPRQVRAMACVTVGSRAGESACQAKSAVLLHHLQACCGCAAKYAQVPPERQDPIIAVLRPRRASGCTTQ